VASLGTYAAPGARMGPVNGDQDPWADWIVAQRFRYVQVNAWYEQTEDVTTADLPSLPENPIGDRIRGKQPDIIASPQAADQVALLAAGLPTFAVAAQRMSLDAASALDAGEGPALVPDPGGHAWVVTQIAPSVARARLWALLADPRTFGSSPDAGLDR
jgi:hypothetical protein